MYITVRSIYEFISREGGIFQNSSALGNYKIP